jgi:hypothetical protein
MMKNGKCPGCGSSDVYSCCDLPLKGGPFNSNCIPISLTSMAAMDNYVCTACGLLESYISDQKKLKEIEKKWIPVNEQQECVREPEDKKI